MCIIALSSRESERALMIIPQYNRQQQRRYSNNASTMSIPRLTFLYPQIYKSARLCEPTVTHPLRELRRPSPKQIAGFHRSVRSRQETHAQRYGPATELHPPPPLPYSVGGGPALETKPERGAIGQAPQEEQKAEPATEKDVQVSNQDSKDNPKPTKFATPSTATVSRPMKLDAAESHPEEPRVPGKEGVSKPLETFLTMETAEEKAEDHKPPHLQAPPYVHHFDTYTLVRDLEKGNFTEDQSVTVMKAVRSLLAVNLHIAREGLESKSDIENVCLLFARSLMNTCIDWNAGNLPLPSSLLGIAHRDLEHAQTVDGEDALRARAAAARS